MILALAVLFFSVPQEYAAAAAAHDKPAGVEIAASVRPTLPERESAGSGSSHSPLADSSLQPPDILFSTDTPSLALVKRFEPRPPANLPANLDLRLPESSAAGRTAPAQPPLAPFHASAETAANRRLWYVLAGGSHAAATFDAWSTRRAISSGQAQEMNPLLRPFAHSNSLYVAVQASPALMDFLGRRMMTSQNHWIRRMWWVPQAAGTATSFLSGVHNLGVVH
jgi:hypothetical protein